MYFVLGSKNTDFFASRGNFVDLAVGRSADKKGVPLESKAMVCAERSAESKTGGRFAVSHRSETLLRGSRRRRRSTPFESTRDGPEIGGIGVGQQRELGSELEAAVASNSDKPWAVAFQEFFIGGLAPATGCARREEATK